MDRSAPRKAFRSSVLTLSTGSSIKPAVTIGISLGDINGIGTEVALKAVQHRFPAGTRIVLIGSAKLVAEQASVFALPIPPSWKPNRAQSPIRKITVWDPSPTESLRWTPGCLTTDASKAAYEWILAAIEACQSGSLDGIVTAPITKEGFARAGIDVPGHTELLATKTQTSRYAMMLFGGTLRVVLVTRHIPLGEVASALTLSGIREAVELTHEALPWLGATNGRIAVCGLNPHAGDGGRIGHEEINIISPAIRTLQNHGLDVTGPIPADTVFHHAHRGDYDAVVAMYHDQGLGPLKMLAFDKGVNVTLGLPLVRTSPDHGTAFDIAGQGIAREHSMVQAMRWAAQLAQRPSPWSPVREENP